MRNKGVDRAYPGAADLPAAVLSRHRCARLSPFLISHSRAMSDHRSRFLHLALHSQALRFGEFTLKSAG